MNLESKDPGFSMKLSTCSHSLIESALQEAVDKFTNNSEQTVITDIHLLPKQGSGELIILDDDDEELARAVIEEWMDNASENFYIDAERVLRSSINRLKEGGGLDNLSILKPYSFVLVDEEKETVTELLLMDDETILVDDELLKGLDDELDKFLKDLLEK